MEAGGFLEWAEFLGNLHGTPVPDAARRRRSCCSRSTSAGPSRSSGRLPRRPAASSSTPPPARCRSSGCGAGATPSDQIRKRLAKAAEEDGLAEDLGVHIVVNDDLDRAVAEIESLIARPESA